MDFNRELLQLLLAFIFAVYLILLATLSIAYNGYYSTRIYSLQYRKHEYELMDAQSFLKSLVGGSRGSYREELDGINNEWSLEDQATRVIT
jgi:hypothetical protein